MPLLATIFHEAKTMWLPTPIYKRIPQFWLLLGLLFMSSGTYIGFDYSVSFLYFGVGLFSCVWSLCIFVLRRSGNQDTEQELGEHSEQSAQDERPEQLAQPTQQSTEQTS